MVRVWCLFYRFLSPIFTPSFTPVSPQFHPQTHSETHVKPILNLTPKPFPDHLQTHIENESLEATYWKDYVLKRSN